MTTLPCGCKTCGCLCHEHYRDGFQECPRHRAAGTLPALIAFALMIATVVMICSIGDDDGVYPGTEGTSIARNAGVGGR